jgi:hypothetical protein
MDVTTIKRMIGQCEDRKQLGEVIVAAKERQELLGKRLYETSVREAWERVKGLEAPVTLYCCAEGTFVGGDMQRGDSMEFNSIQPRRKLLWVKYKEKFRWFSAEGVHRYNLRLEPPAKPMSDSEREMAKRLAEACAKLPG